MSYSLLYNLLSDKSTTHQSDELWAETKLCMHCIIECYLLIIRRIPEMTVQPVKLSMLLASMCSGASQTVHKHSIRPVTADYSHINLRQAGYVMPSIYSVIYLFSNFSAPGIQFPRAKILCEINTLTHCCFIYSFISWFAIKITQKFMAEFDQNSQKRLDLDKLKK